MTYEEFLQNFIPQLNQINSFAGKMRLVKQTFNKIGAGTGRAVFDIDGQKVLKLAMNAKGVAQNEVESNVGIYRDSIYVVAEVFESDENGSWLVAEFGKKVNTKRIEEIAEIPSLKDMYYYIRNLDSLNRGGDRLFKQSEELVEELNENEFTQELYQFTQNYGQQVGDMGRPSSYGEVIRDGQPTIVLTDYGLNDEVYNTHYTRKPQYMYELFNNADGNDDILSDIGGDMDIRRGMWAQVPYSVDDGQGVINEEFINFVNNRKSYPDESISSLPELTDGFHECVNNIKEVLNHVENKNRFFENLISLQEYIIRRGFFPNEAVIGEDATAKFSSDDGINQDGFPAYNNNDTSPSINNSLDANIAMYEDLEYNHVNGDATDDEYMIGEERKKSWVTGAKAVTVKKKCQLGGNGDGTSTACNQGDITNLDFTSIKETIDASDAHNSNDALDAMVRGDKDVSFFNFDYNPEYYNNVVNDNNFKTIPINSKIKNVDMRLVYRDTPVADNKASKLINILNRHGGFLADKTPEEAIEIGTLLDYSEESINQYVNKRYGTPKSITNLNEEDNQPIKTTPEIEEFLSNIDSDETLLRSGGIPTDMLDRAAFGIDDSISQLPPNKLNIKWHDDAENVEWEIKKSGLSDVEWSRNIDLSKPIDVSFDGKKFYIEDGHHRHRAAKTLNKPLNVNLEIKANPIRRLSNLGYDDFHRTIWKQVVNNVTNNENSRITSKIDEEMNEERNIMAIQDLPFREEVEKLGGEIYAVGGAVRDEFLGKDSKDLDIIVRGIPEDKLANLLSKYGKVNAVGESFAVTKFVPNGATDEIDIAVPRTEVSTGEGHKDFEIRSDYKLPIEKDLERRDFTINAIAKDMDDNIIDPFNGMDDLKSGEIRVTHPKSFEDDPLRMLRAVQFASRFNFKIDPETFQMIRDNKEKIKTITNERVQEELFKIVEKGDAGKGAFLLKQTGLLQQMGVDAPLLTSNVWDNVTTLAEFVYLISHNAVNPIKFYMNNLRGDTDVVNELNGLIPAFEANDLTNPAINRSIVHNMILKSKGDKVLQSKIIPEPLQHTAQEFIQGKYPKLTKELAVNGNDLMGKGLKGKEIGDMQKKLLIKIYADKVKNTREDLLANVDGLTPEIKEAYIDEETVETWNINDGNETIDFFVNKYHNWNNQGGDDSGYSTPSKSSVLEFLQNNYEDFSVDKNLNNKLYNALIDKDLLNEEDEGQIQYGCLMLYLDIPNWDKVTSMIDKKDIYNVKNDFGIEDEPHVTLLYGFTDDVNADKVLEVYKKNFGEKPISFTVDKISIFENDEFDVVKFDVESEILSEINSVMKKLPNEETYPDYHPHMTIAYVKKGEGQKYVRNLKKKIGITGTRLVYSTKEEKSTDLDLKGVVKEEKNMENVSYSAVVLDNQSHTRLVQVFQSMIPEGWEVIAHHMTIKIGALDGNKEQADMEAGTVVTLNVVDYAIDNLVMAVGVEGYPTKNAKPHITMAVNREDGGKPFFSNKLVDWKPIKFPISLTGKVEEVGR